MKNTTTTTFATITAIPILTCVIKIINPCDMPGGIYIIMNIILFANALTSIIMLLAGVIRYIKSRRSGSLVGPAINIILSSIGTIIITLISYGFINFLMTCWLILP
jgi:hypothetical protein